MTPADSSSIQTYGWTEIWKDRVLVSFFALLFSLCSADQFFAVRVHGFNVRFGQILLFICAFISFIQLNMEKKTRPEKWEFHVSIFKNWIPFFFLYGLAAWLSPTSERSFIKLGWALFNIGGACLVCLNTRWSKYLERGIIWGILSISLFLIYQAYLIDWAGLSSPWHSPLGTAIYSPYPAPIFGFVQSAYVYMNSDIFRPCAFYYAPAFAACAMALGFCLYLACQNNINNFKTALVGGIILCAIILTSARSGILAMIFIFTYLGWDSFKQKRFGSIRPILKISLVALLLILFFKLAPEGKKYIDYLCGPLGPFGIESRISDPESSEGGRIAIILNGLKIWIHHPILGNGVIPATPTMKGLGQASEDTWVELLMECGTLGFLAFLYAIGKTILNAFKEGNEITPKLWIKAGLLAHFIVSFNFTATYPRLDYWILFFFAIHLLAQRQRQTS
jgi:hypothetical protein